MTKPLIEPDNTKEAAPMTAQPLSYDYLTL